MKTLGDSVIDQPADGSSLSPEERRQDRSLFVGLTVGSIFVSLIAAFVELINEMSFDACGARGPRSVCNYAVADALFPIEVSSILAITAATLVWAAVRSRRGKRIWWLPFVATAAVVAVSVGLVLTVFKMINLSPFAA